ncbi:unnamed protein product, partial [Mesorhabditis belari]|uniref:Uncharacterized protein n=1 Tax=Mesorhabditis belari TaxID=2138241 RepID=A0AAF3EY71_9BILA
MYETILDPEKLAADVVDTVRAGTQAPLSDCVKTARIVFETLLQHTNDDVLRKVSGILVNFQPNLLECFDARLLGTLRDRLDDWLSEKAELSYSISQQDDAYIDDLNTFSNVAEKTDPRIPQAVIAVNDYEFLYKLNNLYIMDQSQEVRLASIRLLSTLASFLPTVICCLIETKLPMVLAPAITSSRYSKEEKSLCIKLLDMMAMSGQEFPLHHLSCFNDVFFSKLSNLHDDKSAIQLFANIYANTPQEVKDFALTTLRSNKNANFGQHLIDFANLKGGLPSITLLKELLSSSPEEVDDLFYRNDLTVASTVVSRELLNSEKREVRVKCLECIGALADLGLNDYSMRDAVENCDVVGEEELIEEIKQKLNQ